MQVLTFEVGGLACAVAVSRAREVLEPPPVTFVPGAPAALSGVLALRGEILAVVDLGVRLGVGARGGRQALLVVHGPADVGPCALLTDGVTGLATVDPAALALPRGLAVAGELLIGVAVHESGMLLVLDLDRVLEPEAVRRQRAMPPAAVEAAASGARRGDARSAATVREGECTVGRMTSTSTQTPTATAISTPTPTPTATPTATAISTPTPTATATATATAISSPTPTATATRLATPTLIRLATSTSTSTRLATPTPTPKAPRISIAPLAATTTSHATAISTSTPASPRAPLPLRVSPLAVAAIVAAALLLRWALAPSVEQAAPPPAVTRLAAAAPAPTSAPISASPVSAPPPPPDSRTVEAPAPAPASLAAPAPRPPAEAPGEVVVVVRGDSLWRIAGRHLGAATAWPRLHRANRETVADPDRISPGMRLVVPGGGAGGR